MIGPVLEALRQYPEVRSLVWGAYGEASRDVHTLLAEIADHIAQREWGRMGSRTLPEARAHIMAQLRRRWGIAARRECARLRIGRLRYVGAPRGRDEHPRDELGRGRRGGGPAPGGVAGYQGQCLRAAVGVARHGGGW